MDTASQKPRAELLISWGWSVNEQEARRYLEYSGLEPYHASEGTRGHLYQRKIFVMIAVLVVSSVLLGPLSFLAFSGLRDTTVAQPQTLQITSEDNLAPDGPLATQDESDARGSPCRISCFNPYPRASFECMGYWYWIVQGFYAGPG